MANGSSIDAIKDKLLGPKKKQQQQAAKKPQKRVHIERKHWDPAQLINSYAKDSSIPGEAPKAPAPKEPSPLELAADVVAAAENSHILSKKVYPVDGGAVLVLVTESAGEVTLRVASDLREPLFLHWGVSKKDKEWTKPPASIVPEGSEDKGQTFETPLKKGFGGQDSVQHVQVPLGKDAGGFVNLPFVLHAAAGWWLKNGGQDFVAPLKKPPPPPKMVGVDASRMAKWLVDEIVNSESEAEKSFMHR